MASSNPFTFGFSYLFPERFLMTSEPSDIFHAPRAEKFPLEALIGKIRQSLLENIYQIHATSPRAVSYLR